MHLRITLYIQSAISLFSMHPSRKHSYYSTYTVRHYIKAWTRVSFSNPQIYNDPTVPNRSRCGYSRKSTTTATHVHIQWRAKKNKKKIKKMLQLRNLKTGRARFRRKSRREKYTRVSTRYTQTIILMLSYRPKLSGRSRADILSKSRRSQSVRGRNALEMC